MRIKSAIFVYILFGITKGLPADTGLGISLFKPKEIINAVHSATNALVDIYFHFDTRDTANDSSHYRSIMGGAVYISTNNGASFVEVLAARINEPGYDSTYQAIYSSNPSTGSVIYYYKVWTDSSVSLWAPNNSTDEFPPSDTRMVRVCNDPAGDEKSVMLPYGAGERFYTNTDLREFWVGYSNAKLYARIRVDGGGFPYSHTERVRNPGCGWPRQYIDINVYHLYTVPIINPRAPYPDSVFFAAIYGDASITVIGIPMVHIYTGLYKVHKLDSTATWLDYLHTYTRLGDISTDISSNTLSLSVDWSLLRGDRDFGPLDMGDFIYTGCGIASFYVCEKNPGCIPSVADTFAYSVNDASISVGLYLKTGGYAITSSSSPVLSNYGANTDLNGANFYCTYTDPENDLPTIREVVVDGVSYTMGSQDHYYLDGSAFSVYVPGVGLYSRYFFRFSDGANIVTTENLTLGIEENSRCSRAFELASVFPNPFNSSVNIPVCVYENLNNFSLDILNTSGQKVTSLFKGKLQKGNYIFNWNPKINTKKELPSGLYVLSVSGDNRLEYRTIIYIK